MAIRLNARDLYLKLQTYIFEILNTLKWLFKLRMEYLLFQIPPIIFSPFVSVFNFAPTKLFLSHSKANVLFEWNLSQQISKFVTNYNYFKHSILSNFCFILKSNAWKLTDKFKYICLIVISVDIKKEFEKSVCSFEKRTFSVAVC